MHDWTFSSRRKSKLTPALKGTNDTMKNTGIYDFQNSPQSAPPGLVSRVSSPRHLSGESGTCSSYTRPSRPAVWASGTLGGSFGKRPYACRGSCTEGGQTPHNGERCARCLQCSTMTEYRRISLQGLWLLLLYHILVWLRVCRIHHRQIGRQFSSLMTELDGFCWNHRYGHWRVYSTHLQRNIYLYEIK